MVKSRYQIGIVGLTVKFHCGKMQVTKFYQKQREDIQEIVDPRRWLFVPSSNNSTDIAARKVFFENLKKASMWWIDSEFLSLRKTVGKIKVISYHEI